MACTTIDILSECRNGKQNNDCQNCVQQAGETMERSHFFGSLKSALLVSQWVLLRYQGFPLAVYRGGRKKTASPANSLARDAAFLRRSDTSAAGIATGGRA